MPAKPKRILVYGGRDYAHVVRTVGNPADEPPETIKRLREYIHLHAVLNKLACEYSDLYSETDNWLPTDITIISGGADGADKAAIDFAICSYCQWTVYPAGWDKLGRAAGPIRNQQMIDEGKPDIAVEFPGGKGTDNMHSKMVKANIRILYGVTFKFHEPIYRGFGVPNA